MRTRETADKGFTLIELLVVVIIIGILAAIATPVFMNQKARAYDASVKSDLKSYATQAETWAADNGGYAPSSATFAPQGATTPIASPGNEFQAYVVTGAEPGFVIFGRNENAGTTWFLSSFDGSAPGKAEEWPTGDPSPGAYWIPLEGTVNDAGSW